MSNSIQDCLNALAAIRVDTHTLRQVCLTALRYDIQYLPPLFSKDSNLTDDGPVERVLDFTGNEFSPIDVRLNDRINDVWGFTAPPNRVKSSLPRYLGYIALPKEYIDYATSLINSINDNKAQFLANGRQLHKEIGLKQDRITDTLIHSLIIEPTENFELITRPIIDTQHHKVTKVSNRWVIKPSQPKTAKPAEDTIATLETDGKYIIIEAIKQFEILHPGSKYAVRYENPPSPEIRFNYSVDTNINERGLALKRIANSSPLIVLNWDENTQFNGTLKPLDVDYNPTTNTFSVINRKHKENEPVRLLATENWYGFPVKN
ncbi:hypothetical protein J9B83_15455 [Marinomonas sp. A79]|uniref:Uncharacterized protein n=1 Tax=Marinomonas vulgaris TaxID=2823372 RepID=A0ABS5HF78_9GAMM|nr:hypothetical protein [Marinomonas vulgaris]MBR7890290.1 hypothetical protein [Marinomonas vulgaris]